MTLASTGSGLNSRQFLHPSQFIQMTLIFNVFGVMDLFENPLRVMISPPREKNTCKEFHATSGNLRVSKVPTRTTQEWLIPRSNPSPSSQLLKIYANHLKRDLAPGGVKPTGESPFFLACNQNIPHAQRKSIYNFSSYLVWRSCHVPVTEIPLSRDSSP